MGPVNMYKYHTHKKEVDCYRGFTEGREPGEGLCNLPGQTRCLLVESFDLEKKDE